MNQTTRVIRFHKTGGPEVLRIEEVRRPKPTGNEVLVRVQALGLSRPDLVWRESSCFEEPVFPAQIGYDAAGVVESIGPEVKKLRVGDRVATFPAVSLLDDTAHSEMIVYPETALHVYPDKLTPMEAAAVNMGLFTAYFALIELSGLKRDQYVVVTAASSSMGIAAIQMSRAIRAKCIAVTRSETKKEGLLAVGANEVIIAGRDDVQEAILKLTDGLGAEVIYDAVGGPGLEELIWATKRFGHIIVYGQLGAMDDKTSLPLGACFLRGLKVHASFRVYDFTGYPKLGLPARTEEIERAKKFVSDGLASGLFPPMVDRVFLGLDEYVAAHRRGGYLHLIPEDYGMLHFQRGALDPRDFWHQVPATMGSATGTDLFVGRNTFGILAEMKLEQITVDYIVVDTVRVPRDTFADIIEAWRDGYAEPIGELTPITREAAVAYFDQMIANIRDPQGYAVWMVPVVSAQVV